MTKSSDAPAPSSTHSSQLLLLPSSMLSQESDETPSFISSLCDDTLLRILSYADLTSVIYFTRGTSHSLRHRFHSVRDLSCCCPDIWQEVFTNHNFAPVDDNDNAVGTSSEALLQNGELIQTTNYLNAIRERLSLWSNLSGNSLRRRKKLTNGGRYTKQCFSLPSRMFHFVPLVPPDMMHFPPASGSNNNDISFSYLDDGSLDEDDDGHGVNDMSFELDPNDNMGAENNVDLDHHHGTAEFDPPPVEFACDSFALTSPGTGTEFVLLNPFSGSVEIYDSILDNAISSDESMLEQALMDASENIIRKRRGHRGGGRRGGGSNERGASHEDDDLPDESSEVIAGEAIHNRMINLNHKMYDTPPRQVLFSVQDYFDLDMDEYFGQYTPFASIVQRREQQGNVTVDWVGVDSHIALAKNDTSIAGNIIGAARILTMESDRGDEEELACTEVYAWSNFGNNADTCGRSASYDSRLVCRSAGSFYFLDICANYGKLYAAFQSGCCPFQDGYAVTTELRRGNNDNRQLMDIEEESMVNEDGEPIQMSKAIYCLPLVEYSDSPRTPEEISSYFPEPDACIVAQYPVSSFSIDPTGKILVVGTICGTVEVWHTGMDPHNSPTAPRRLQILSVREAFMKRHRAMTMDERHTALCGGDNVDSSSIKTDIDDRPNHVEFDENAAETQDDLALVDNGTSEDVEFPHKHPTSKISQIYLPRHLPAHQCGFITKQRTPESGTTLLLWQTANMSSEKTDDLTCKSFHVTAMINLPLSTRCHPEVHFDGRRLIVFGKDHIGMIFLVYHVLGTRYDQDEFDDEDRLHKKPRKASSRKNIGNHSYSNNGEESGGVVQIAGERRIKFVNRIRHAGLGGLEYFDSMLLSANERFLLVNTKTGNLVGSDGVRNASEGLLVIDLQEYGCY